MPIIQVVMTDEELEQLLDLTHQKTGTKAIKYCIEGYKIESEMHEKYARLFGELRREYDTLRTRVSNYMLSFDLLRDSIGK